VYLVIFQIMDIISNELLFIMLILVVNTLNNIYNNFLEVSMKYFIELVYKINF
jgi:hypothetical protein